MLDLYGLTSKDFPSVMRTLNRLIMSVMLQSRVSYTEFLVRRNAT